MEGLLVSLNVSLSEKKKTIIIMFILLPYLTFSYPIL